MMDHFGVERAVLVGWSMGVNTAFEIAVDHPERVAGLFAIAGVPGDTFSTMLRPLRVPPAAARTVAVGAAHVLRYGGRLLSPVTTSLPVGRRAIDVLTAASCPWPTPSLARPAVAAFLQTPVEWYFHVAVHTSRATRGSGFSKVRARPRSSPAPGTSWPGHHAMRSAAEKMADATYTELRGTQFPPDGAPRGGPAAAGVRA